ncbi:hypothetical protein P186_0599 [Pyrobaculum ferrireducens]|uniref:Uncharacterized protein n=1 Tax=Pyrobaculum ferrireducens TaxID=1104324 RepID=G7VHM9_9CREN|nr:hypothetical protein P186_0599 [Pyrobaculum ferrireducens]
MDTVPLQFVRQVDDCNGLERTLVHAYPTANAESLGDHRLLQLVIDPHHLPRPVHGAVLHTLLATLPRLARISVNNCDANHAPRYDVL